MTDLDHLFRTAKKCPYCWGVPILVKSEVVYGPNINYGPLWYCPGCGAYVGCHKGTAKPLGFVADAALRRKRNEAHVVFDAMWKKKAAVNRRPFSYYRLAAYTWLSQHLDTELKYTHIAMMDAAQCDQIIQLCKKRGNAFIYERAIY